MNQILSQFSQQKLLLMLLCCLVVGRGLTLEYGELIDPTESRYAFVAQEMVRSGDWVTPKLPQPEGVVPYLGKPPLHFWLAAIAATMFEVDEWAARLPSYLAALIILLATYFTCYRRLGQTPAVIACYTLFSSAMFFFVAGASVTDISLTACVFLGQLFLFSYFLEQKQSTAVFATISGALAFLTKGPVGLVLIWAPIGIWLLMKKDVAKLKRFPWLASILIFLILVMPWFILAEIRNPGFLKYFVWNENIARFFLEDYGDKYGSGHVQPHGMSWIMLLLGFMPWSVILLYQVFKEGLAGTLSTWRSDPFVLYVILAGLFPPLFFTFMKQLHAMYLLPAFPWLAILCGFSFARVFKTKLFAAYSRPTETSACYSMWGLALLTLLALPVVGFIISGSYLALLGLIIFALFFVSTKIVIKSSTNFDQFALAWAATVLSVVLSITPYVNSRRSTEEVLQQLVADTKVQNPTIGVVSRNSYSQYWLANVSLAELDHQFSVEYVNPDILDQANTDYLLVKKGSVPTKVLAGLKNYKTSHTAKKWIILESSNLVEDSLAIAKTL